MTNAEKKRKLLNRADMITGIEGAIVRGGAIMVLFRLLYKQKIRPITAVVLALAYRLNDTEVITKARDDCYKYLLDTHEVSDELEKKDNKTMGFDIN